MPVPQTSADAAILRKEYTGIFGLKVFWLALLTLVPLLLPLKLSWLSLDVSISTGVYALYHALGIYIWAHVKHGLDLPDLHTAEEWLKWRKLRGLHRPLSYAVYALLVVTFLAKANFQFLGSHRFPLPQFLHELVGVAPRVNESQKSPCTANDLRLSMEIDGNLVPGRRGGGDDRFAGGRLYQFTLANTSERCTAIIESIELAVLAETPDGHGLLEAETASNDYEVLVSPDDVDGLLSIIPLEGAPRSQWSFDYAPRSSPDRFRVHVVPTPWGHSYAIQFVVTWYDPAIGDRKLRTRSEVYAAFFPDPDPDVLFPDNEETLRFRASVRQQWSNALKSKVY